MRKKQSIKFESEKRFFSFAINIMDRERFTFMFHFMDRAARADETRPTINAQRSQRESLFQIIFIVNRSGWSLSFSLNIGAHAILKILQMQSPKPKIYF
jgi:hypothetical protein